MDIGTVLSVVQTLLSATQCPQLIAFCSKKSISDQLDQLQGTVRRIQAVLQDAEFKLFLNNEEKVYIDELKDAIFDADDLFDEFVTHANMKELNDSTMDRILSVFTKFKFDNKICKKIDKINRKFDDITRSNQLISFKHDPEPLKKRSRETCSYVHVVDIIGRDADLEKIVGMLLQSDGRQAVSFLSIVGIGGLGKTALAQLVFNDPRVISAFSLKMWICVSDQDQHGFDEKEIIGKILEAAIGEKHHDATKDRLQNQLRQALDGKKYLLMLDDVWTENREQWCKLADFLMGGQRGSWVLVTTRSRQTAKIVGDGLIYELNGLSKDDSWHLFEKVAFEPELSCPPEDLVDIGQKIVEKCANVPLAIRVAGSLLYGQDKRKWLSFQELPLTKFGDNENGIMPILKISYHQLESPLKSCFGYCALFPKDYVIQKKTLLRLWMAQGFIPSCDQTSMEDVAEEYFLVLLRRSFFQDVTEDEFGEIASCKIHDLMHDVAKEVVGKEICMVDSNFDVVDKKVWHISTLRKENKIYTFHRSCTRSYLLVPQFGAYKMDKLLVDALLSNWKYLRVLDLSDLNITSLSSSIGKLLHLRYLDLSRNSDLDQLPLQITKLYNLETLILQFCTSLKELPKDLSKLVKLRALDLEGCDNLSFLPMGMGNLTCLEELSMFPLSESNSSSKKVSSDLEDLNALTNLKGHIEIKVRSWKKDGKGGREGGCLRNKPHLYKVMLTFSKENCEGRMEDDEAMIEELHPHSNIKSLEITLYQGVRMPKWAREDTFANLMYMNIRDCSNLESLGCLETLHHLKSLSLYGLKNLEWVSREGTSEISPCSVEGGMSLNKAKTKFSFFPSLETLSLKYLPKLKAWRRGVGMGMEDSHQVLHFPKLKDLDVIECPNLVAELECPALITLILESFNKNLVINSIERRKIENIEKGVKDDVHKLEEASPIPNILKLRNTEIQIDNLGWLNCQHINMEEVASLTISYDEEMLSLEEGREVFRSWSSSLRFLIIDDCRNLRSVSGGLEHLTALEMLVIKNCPNLSLSEGGYIDVVGSSSESDNGMPWKPLSHSLRTLNLWSLPQLIDLPSWIQFLTALQTLEIVDCKNLNSLPSWMPTLKKLTIRECSGEDWPHIQHISSFAISEE